MKTMKMMINDYFVPYTPCSKCCYWNEVDSNDSRLVEGFKCGLGKAEKIAAIANYGTCFLEQYPPDKWATLGKETE